MTREQRDKLVSELSDKIQQGVGYPAILKVSEPTALDTQEGGTHYKDMKIQPIEFITANELDFLQGNVVKYIARHKAKNGAQDVRKALHYCQLILELQYGETGK